MATACALALSQQLGEDVEKGQHGHQPEHQAHQSSDQKSSWVAVVLACCCVKGCFMHEAPIPGERYSVVTVPMHAYRKRIANRSFFGLEAGICRPKIKQNREKRLESMQSHSTAVLRF